MNSPSNDTTTPEVRSRLLKMITENEQKRRRADSKPVARS